MEWADTAEQAAFRTEVRSFIEQRLPDYFHDDYEPVGLETGDWQAEFVLGSDEARAAEVLEHLRRERGRTQSAVLPVRDWIGTCPIVAGFSTMAAAAGVVRVSLERLAKSRHVTVQRGRAQRWDVHAWTVTLL